MWCVRTVLYAVCPIHKHCSLARNTLRCGVWVIFVAKSPIKTDAQRAHIARCSEGVERGQWHAPLSRVCRPGVYVDNRRGPSAKARQESCCCVANPEAADQRSNITLICNMPYAMEHAEARLSTPHVGSILHVGSRLKRNRTLALPRPHTSGERQCRPPVRSEHYAPPSDE